MTMRLPAAMTVALMLHAGAGIWLGSAMRDPEPAPFVEDAGLMEVELLVPEDMAGEAPPPVEMEEAEPAVPEAEPIPEPENEKPPEAEMETPPEPEVPVVPKAETVKPPEPVVRKVELARPPRKVERKPEAPKPVARRSDKSASGSTGGGGGTSGRSSGRSSSGAGPSSGPVCISRPAPSYPAALLDRRIGGTVTVEVMIDEKGRVTSTRLLSGSGQSALDRSALSGVRRWKFRPALRRGVPVPAGTRVNVVFKPQ